MQIDGEWVQKSFEVLRWRMGSIWAEIWSSKDMTRSPGSLPVPVAPHFFACPSLANLWGQWNVFGPPARHPLRCSRWERLPATTAATSPASPHPWPPVALSFSPLWWRETPPVSLGRGAGQGNIYIFIYFFYIWQRTRLVAATRHKLRFKKCDLLIKIFINLFKSISC